MTLGQRIRSALDFCDRLLASHLTRLALSVLIVVSVLPESVQSAIAPVPWLNFFFLTVFGCELVLRLALFVRSWRQRRAGRWAVALLLIDALAVISFLPLEQTLGSRYFRLVRLCRLLLLFGYWGRQARELLSILSGPERRFQVVAVLFLALLVSFVGALLIHHLVPAYDFDGDGEVASDDRSFFRILWWSFRQVQDSGNLVAEVDEPPVLALSLSLTLVGVFLFSVIVGIGTGVIEELLERSREQPVRLSDHTVILGVTPHSSFLFEELARIYRKNLRSFRAAVLGRDTRAPAYLNRPLLRAIQYRSGNPVLVDDLERVNVERARRVLILGTDPLDPDGDVVSAILATRERNPGVDLFPAVDSERNFPAVRAAGGRRTHVVGSGSFLGHYVVQNVIFPGIYRIHRHLLTSAGCEVYTYYFSREERRRLAAVSPWDVHALHRRAFRHFGLSLIGLLTAPDPEIELEDDDLDVLLNPVAAAESGSGVVREGRVHWRSVRGVIGIALRAQNLRLLARSLVSGAGVPEDRADEAAGLRELVLRPARRTLERVLIAGASPRVPRVVAELCGSFPRLDVTVVTSDAARFRPLMLEVEARLIKSWGRSPIAGRTDDMAVFQRRGGTVRSRVVLLLTDWTDSRRLQREEAVDLESADAVLLLPHEAPGGPGIDGTVALDCLHMANLVQDDVVQSRPGLHILGMMRDPVKGDLLESRLARLVGDDGDPSFTLISSERARHHFIMQNVFVRGLNNIYLDLLSVGGQQLARLVPFAAGGGCPAGDLRPARLADDLLRERGLVFLGYEAGSPGEEPRVELDPSRMLTDPPTPWSEVRALYVLGAQDAW